MTFKEKLSFLLPADLAFTSLSLRTVASTITVDTVSQDAGNEDMLLQGMVLCLESQHVEG